MQLHRTLKYISNNVSDIYTIPKLVDDQYFSDAGLHCQSSSLFRFYSSNLHYRGQSKYSKDLKTNNHNHDNIKPVRLDELWFIHVCSFITN